MYLYIFICYIYNENNIRLKIRDLVRRGSRAGNQLKIEAPKVSATSPADKLQRNIAKQANG